MEEDRYQRTSIWSNTLARRENDPEEASRSRLRNSYESLRRNVAQLSSRISAEIPQITLHDVGHLDALWTTADLVAGVEFKLTPAEAFVFGGSILLHDTGLAFASVPGGLEAIQGTPQWRDSAMAILQSAQISPITQAKIAKPPPELFGDILFAVLRALHGKIAETLASSRFENIHTKEELYLLEDSAFRLHYGPLIGQIAASHTWDLEELPIRLQSRVGAISGIPSEWTIDPVRIACLLRCADAAQIDQRRAPDVLFALLKLRGVSKDHWLAQNKLAQPIRDPDDSRALLFSSTGPYGESASDAWWVAYDLVSVVNRELLACNALLRDTHREEFQANRVRDADSPARFARHVTTQGWAPVAVNIQVSDAIGVAGMLGGEVLYGNAPFVPIRELIQNAADAIRARRYFEKTSQAFEGRIIVRLKHEKEGLEERAWLEIEDNGIGMSERVLVGPFLDFGTSLWSNRLVESEFPGLRGSEFRASGRFGIGFYSVFMIADKVFVSSRRFDQGLEGGRTLVFSDGLATRPVILKRLLDEFPSSSQTLIKFRLKPEVASQFDDGKVGLLTSDQADSIKKQGRRIAFEDIVKKICLSLDCDVHANSTKIHDRFWYQEDGLKWLEEIAPPQKDLMKKHHALLVDASERLSLIVDGERVVGRAAISTYPHALDYAALYMSDGSARESRTDMYLTGFATLGGLTTDNPHLPGGTSAFFGLIENYPDHASRYVNNIKWDLSDFFLNPQQRDRWLEEQLDKLSRKQLTKDQTVAYQENLARFGLVVKGYYQLRIIELDASYSSLDDVQIVSLGELDLLGAAGITIPTKKLKRKRILQTLTYFDDREFRAIKKFMKSLSIDRMYVPTGTADWQCTVPGDLSASTKFSGILAALAAEVRSKEFSFAVTLTELPKLNLDKETKKIIDPRIDGLVHIKWSPAEK